MTMESQGQVWVLVALVLAQVNVKMDARVEQLVRKHDARMAAQRLHRERPEFSMAPRPQKARPQVSIYAPAELQHLKAVRRSAPTKAGEGEQ